MKPKFTIVLLHYNQMEYIYEALDSIIDQSYDNIELIISDDCSKKFDKAKIEKYIKKSTNIKDIKFVINEKNIGTVKTLNRCVKIATGKYLLFFAADDKLYNKNVIANYVKTFKKLPEDYDIVASQCYMYDSELKLKYYDFVTKYYAERVNKYSSKELFSETCKGCIFAAGATAYRTSLFKKVDYFDEKYRVIEDWAFYLKCARLGIRLYYEPFGGLKHRAGGVSHNNSKVIPPHVIQYHKDICKIYATDILPYWNKLNISALSVATRKYEQYSNRYKEDEKLPILIRFLISLYVSYKYALNVYRKIIAFISNNKFILFNVLLCYLSLSMDNLEFKKCFNIYAITVLLILIINYILIGIKNIFKGANKNKNKRF